MEQVPRGGERSPADGYNRFQRVPKQQCGHSSTKSGLPSGLQQPLNEQYMKLNSVTNKSLE